MMIATMVGLVGEDSEVADRVIALVVVFMVNHVGREQVRVVLGSEQPAYIDAVTVVLIGRRAHREIKAGLRAVAFAGL